MKSNEPGPLIVLTGASGKLGHAVHRTLLEAGQNIRAVDKLRSPSPDLNVMQMDLHHEESCRTILKDAQVLVHLAYARDPLIYPPRTFDEHIRLNRTLFQAAQEAGAKKILFASTIQVIAPQIKSAAVLPLSLPLDENCLPRPDNWYSLSKLCTEEMLAMIHQVYGIDCISIRFPILTNRAPYNHEVWHDTRLSEGFSYLTYWDAAELILQAIKTDLPGCRIYMPASRKNCLNLPVQEVLRKRYEGVPLLKPAQEIESLVDLSSLTRDLAWEPRELTRPEALPAEPWFERLKKQVIRRLGLQLI